MKGLSEKPAGHCLIFPPLVHPPFLAFMDLPQHLFIGCVETRASEDMEGRAHSRLAVNPCASRRKAMLSASPHGDVPLLPALSAQVFGGRPKHGLSQGS